MNVWLEKWWDHDRKLFSIISYRDSWSKNGTGMQFSLRTNGAKKSRPTDTCFSVTLQIGYLDINYTNFNYQDRPYIAPGSGSALYTGKLE